ncbi:MAG: hypothetical protein AB7O65_11615 [Candidatus Korobacteraceae bacterium]
MRFRDVLDTLKAELDFLELGGYDHALGAPWRPAFIFEDSPTCMNFRKPVHADCMGCPLLSFVPEERRNEPSPCRFIPLNDRGQTLNYLYSACSQAKTVETVREWLKATIASLEDAARKETPSAPQDGRYAGL